ncbi:MAG: hypothetical protein ACLTG4_08270 [Oscillospiraceae bacterium]
MAYKLLCALEGNSDRVLRDYGDPVAIGTVADVMPSRARTATLWRRDWCRSTLAPGRASALLHECGAEGRTVTATTIGFTLAPRINAAGRRARRPSRRCCC